MGGGGWKAFYWFVKQSYWGEVIDKMDSDSSQMCMVVGINGLRLWGRKLLLEIRIKFSQDKYWNKFLRQVVEFPSVYWRLALLWAKGCTSRGPFQFRFFSMTLTFNKKCTKQNQHFPPPAKIKKKQTSANNWQKTNGNPV